VSRLRGASGRPAVLGVDGGNSKIDALVVDRAGKVLGAARRIGPSNVARTEASLETMNEAIRAACDQAKVALDGGPVAPLGVYCLAGADFPMDDRRIARAVAGRGWTHRNLVRNDTLAVLRAGTDRTWGVAVVCGAGMNCVGIDPAGRVFRFPALGPLSGDLAAGGQWVGLAALAAAIRARDGRGPRTALERAVPAHFDMARPETVMNAMHRGKIPHDRLVELPPAVFAAAASGDAVAREILDELADEIVAMATASIRRLRLENTDVHVVLGGGIFRSNDPAFMDRIEAGVKSVAGRARVRTLDVPPVAGAVLIGLEEIGAGAKAADRLRRSIDHATIEALQRHARRVPAHRSTRRSAR
jgi:N-acetylglucosamine kinase-like BadF-type ATPase